MVLIIGQSSVVVLNICYTKKEFIRFINERRYSI